MQHVRHSEAPAGYGLTMDSANCEPDPFSSDSLWRLSRFSIEALQPLEALPWNSDLPGMDPFARSMAAELTADILV